ncbi:bsr2802 [Bradyrhizobium diazoefficiens USDA 110]|uniref:Bsr2802 protein n=1 Tax=Bradyrhizobium diazoefficiens (strain JCM 10833 / BCRC 13528 / IAM 13628 / NBRC 14792 / USDA 110) TaxID=224911 RepID=Q89RH0_BRADU|nr:hypothetical protein CO678_03890 [Bradyrhizobium diazoefficiens]QBP21628.1 hypothetical protein Bdiaspc4_14490 [Bradyrhizobium diazoefficiens]QHP72145.1 hypothetical protein EI171_35480 [Bradyrhizobium sp. LCT2]BAC48067.1 bsr2802 [Bradyrhizobium diazoefficiens USDA 110]
MRQAAVFVDDNGNASRVPLGCDRKGKRFQLDGTRLDPAFAGSAAFCLGGCIRFVRRTRNEQSANFACAAKLRQTGAVHLTY